MTVAVRAGTPLRDLQATLAEHGIGAVVVSDNGTEVGGIVSERDVVRHLHHDGTVINNTVGAIMTTAVETCSPADDLDEVMGTMTRRRFRHIPVVDADGALAGLVSIGDVVKNHIDQLEEHREQLEAYITG